MDAFQEDLLPVDAAEGVILEKLPGFEGLHQLLRFFRGHSFIGDPDLFGVDDIHQRLPLAEADAAGDLQGGVELQFRHLIFRAW